MNVAELRLILQQLEVDGLGRLPVVFKVCECHDSDYAMIESEVVEVSMAEANSMGPAGIANGTTIIRLETE